MTDPQQIAGVLGLEPLPGEGGLFRRTFTAEHVTAIAFMLIGEEFSAMHRLPAHEVYFFQAGAPLRLLLIDDDGPREVILGPDPLAGHLLQLEVPPGCWQGSSSSGDWSLVATIVTPGFEWEMLELGSRSDLVCRWPAAEARIAQLTRIP